MDVREYREFRNPLTWTDVKTVTFVTIAVMIIGPVLFLISNNPKVLWITLIFIAVEVAGFLLPQLLTKPSKISMENVTFSIKTRFGRTLSYPYENISYIKLGRGQSYGVKYGVFQTTSQNYGSYFIRYEIAEALLLKCQENVNHMPRVEVEP